MDNFRRVLFDGFGAQLAEAFKPCALYYDCMDYVEYVTHDTTSVADRIDEFLTVLWNGSRDEIIGFRVKGFKFLFNTKLKSLYNLTDNDFIPLISVLQAVVEQVGDDLLRDDKRHKAYKKAIRLARESNVDLYDVPFAARAA